MNRLISSGSVSQYLLHNRNLPVRTLTTAGPSSSSGNITISENHLTIDQKEKNATDLHGGIFLDWLPGAALAAHGGQFLAGHVATLTRTAVEFLFLVVHTTEAQGDYHRLTGQQLHHEGALVA
jgi:hypothetical protein